MQIELENCPFCGGRAKHIKGHYMEDGEKFVKVYCRNLECNVRTDPCKTLVDAAAKWNRRKYPLPMDSDLSGFIAFAKEMAGFNPNKHTYIEAALREFLKCQNKN